MSYDCVVCVQLLWGYCSPKYCPGTLPRDDVPIRSRYSLAPSWQQNEGPVTITIPIDRPQHSRHRRQFCNFYSLVFTREASCSCPARRCANGAVSPVHGRALLFSLLHSSMAVAAPVSATPSPSSSSDDGQTPTCWRPWFVLTPWRVCADVLAYQSLSDEEFARQELGRAVLKILKVRKEHLVEVESMALHGMVGFTEKYLETVFARAKTLRESAGV